jgi:8-amino-7-oxononanoate synthase
LKTTTLFPINFCSNDYLSLAKHPKIKQAFKQGVDKFGVGAGASHLISGHTSAHQELEEAFIFFSSAIISLCK